MAKEYVVFHGSIAVAGVPTLEEANKILARYNYNGHIKVEQCFRYSPRNTKEAGFTSGNTASTQAG